MKDDLEQFIHEELVRLPEMKAPPDLVDSIMDRIREQKPLPWWKLPIGYWHPALRVAAMVLFSSCALGLLGMVFLLVALPDFAWMLSGMEIWGGAFNDMYQQASTWIQGLSPALGVWVNDTWVWALLAVVSCAYLAFIGLGSVLVRYLSYQTRGT